LLEPRFKADNPRLVSPGVKLGVRPDSFTHTTELFGPLLGVMRARSLAHAVELANQTGYGLTGGLASLDEREQRYFCEHMRAGNLYVNRTITGAIVQRQPFGGVGKSGFGPGAKAGGPNYVAQLCHASATGPRTSTAEGQASLAATLEGRLTVLQNALDGADARRLREWSVDYARAQREHFGREHDPAQVLGQHNRFRYRPRHDVLLRVEADARALDVAASCLAAALADARVAVSCAPGFTVYADASLLGLPLTVETLEQLLQRAPRVARLRLLGSRSALHDQLNQALGAHIADEPVLPLGRFELLHYVSEQSVSLEYHRYGHVMSEEQTAPKSPVRSVT
jgi:RHH-type proline utilization regulon transcriptional repressor/proline dehydrogenase/delta 1-pyrroline-5-carboxylate dehydrogenase